MLVRAQAKEFSDTKVYKKWSATHFMWLSNIWKLLIALCDGLIYSMVATILGGTASIGC